VTVALLASAAWIDERHPKAEGPLRTRPEDSFKDVPSRSPEIDPAEAIDPGVASRSHVGGYDEAAGRFVLVEPKSLERARFSLNFDMITQLIFIDFSRSAKTWVNNAGATPC